MLWLLSHTVFAAATPGQQTGAWTYAFAEYGDIKYPSGFSHYDFVNPDAPKGGVLRLSNPDRRTSFDKYNPYTLPLNSPAAIKQFMFESLADASPDEPATMYALLASEMLVAPDYSSITFRINPLAHFNNGDPVTAEDVRYSFDTAVGPLAEPGYAQQFQGVREAIVIDPVTIRFNLRAPSRDQIYLLGTQMAVFSRKWGQGPDGKPRPFDQIVHDVPIATGPYLIAKGTGKLLDLVRDPHYWARDLGVRRGYYNFEHLIYHYYSDDSVKFEAFKAGDFDLQEELSGQRYIRQYVGPKFRDGEIRKRQLPNSMGFFYAGFLFNSRRPLFADSRVRDALNYAFDWSWSLAQALNLGVRYKGLFANSPYAAESMPSPGELSMLAPYRKDLPPQVFEAPAPNPVSDTPAQVRANLLHARDLLAAAGWTIRPDGLLRNARNETFQFEILEDDLQLEPQILRWAVGLKKLGILAHIRLVDFAIYQKRTDAFDFDCTFITYDSLQMPSANLLADYLGSAAATTAGSDNIMGISSPAIDHIIDLMRQATALDQILDGSRALDRLFMAGHYAIPYMYRPFKLVAYWNRFGMPGTVPKYYTISNGLGGMAWPVSTWWTNSGAGSATP